MFLRFLFFFMRLLPPSATPTATLFPYTARFRSVTDGSRVRYHRAGHILGAASIEIDWKGRTILFSGDIGRYGDAVMKDPEPPARADYVLVESTYGDRRHEQVDPKIGRASCRERVCQNV